MKINEMKRKELTRKVMTRMVMSRKEMPRKVKLLILTIIAVVEIALMIGFIVLLAINVSKTNFGVSNWIWVHWEYIFGIVYPMLFYITDLSSIHNEALSDETKRKWRVKDNSFLRKIIPIKEGKVLIDEVHWKYRYVLYPRVLPVFIQSIIIILGLIVLAIHFVFVPFIPDLVFFIIGITSIFTSLIHTGLMMTATHLNL